MEDEFQALKTSLDTNADRGDFNGLGLTNGGVGTVNIQVGVDSTASENAVRLRGLKLSALAFGVADLKVGISKYARDSLKIIDSALDRSNLYRSGIGAVRNRLDSAYDSASAAHEAGIVSASVIQDADMAKETAARVREQIRSQAGMAAMAQAKGLSNIAVSMI